MMFAQIDSDELCRAIMEKVYDIDGRKALALFVCHLADPTGAVSMVDKEAKDKEAKGKFKVTPAMDMAKVRSWVGKWNQTDALVKMKTALIERKAPAHSQKVGDAIKALGPKSGRASRADVHTLSDELWTAGQLPGQDWIAANRTAIDALKERDGGFDEPEPDTECQRLRWLHELIQRDRCKPNCEPKHTPVPVEHSITTVPGRALRTIPTALKFYNPVVQVGAEE